MTIWSWDLETYLIQKRDQAPKPVCTSYSNDGVNAGLCRIDDPVHWNLWANPANIFVGHNISYDILALLRWHPNYIPHVIRALSEGRVFDTMIRESMIHLENKGGLGYRPFVGLDKLVLKYEGVDITEDKKDESSWRLRYGTLDYTPIEQWPAKAIQYALDDARYTWKVFHNQGSLNNIQPTEALQVQADVVLQSIGVWGFGVNKAKNAEMEYVQRELLEDYEAKIGHRGWWGTGSKKRLANTVVARISYKQAAMIAQSAPIYGCQFNWDVWQEKYQLTDLREHLIACHNNQVVPEYIISDTAHRVSYLVSKISDSLPGIPLTAKGAVKADEETFKQLFDVEPDLERLVAYRHEQKMLSTYIMPFADMDVSNARYTNLNSTGRTSASPGHQTIPRSGGYRDQFCPRPGNKFGTVDYSALELCTLAAAIRHEYPNQRCVLGERIDNGDDVHSYTASLIVDKPYEEVLAGKKDKYKDARQGAKACYSADTEIWTPQGWKLISSLQESDPVCQYDPRTNKLSDVVPALHRYEDCAFMHYNFGGVNLLVTPDHRVFADAGDGFEKRTAEDWFSVDTYMDFRTFSPSENSFYRCGGHTKHWGKSYYRGDSYCVTVPTGLVVVRRNGSVPVVCSNSNFGFPGGLWIKAFLAYAENNYGVTFTFDEAKGVRDAWSKAFPEIDGQYLKAHKKLCPKKNDRAKSTLINGRSKAQCVFTELSNFKFQGLAADGAKLALWNIWSEIMLSWYHQNIGVDDYGREYAGSPLSDSRIPAFVHDEIVMEHPDNEKGASAFERQKDLMVSSMATMCNNLITISVEGEFSERWAH